MANGTFLPLAIQVYGKQLQFEDFYKIKYLELELHILDLRYLDHKYFLKNIFGLIATPFHIPRVLML